MRIKPLSHAAEYDDSFGAIDGEEGVSVDDAILYWDALTPEHRAEVKRQVEARLTKALSPPADRHARYNSAAPLEILARGFPAASKSYESGDITKLRLGHNVAPKKVDAFLETLVGWDDFVASRLVADANGGGGKLKELLDARPVTLDNAYGLWRMVKGSGDRLAIEALAAKLVAFEQKTYDDAAQWPTHATPRFAHPEIHTLALALKEAGAEVTTPEVAFAAARATLLTTNVTTADAMAARRFPALAAAADFAEARAVRRPWTDTLEIRASEQQDKGYDAIVDAERELEKRVDTYVKSLSKMQRQNLANTMSTTYQSSLLEIVVRDEDKDNDTYEYRDDHCTSWPTHTPAMMSNDRLPKPPVWPSADELATTLKTRMREEIRRFITFIRDDADEGHIEIASLVMTLRLPY